MHSRRTNGVMLFALLVIMVIITLSSADSAFAVSSVSPKKVLILNGNYKGYAWTDDITEGILSSLNQDAHHELFVEYLDLYRFPGNTYEYELLEMLTEKYRSQQINLIITTDAGSLALLNQWQFRFPMDVPVICSDISHPYSTNSHRDKSRLYLSHTGLDAKSTIDMALTLNPTLTSIHLVHASVSKSMFNELHGWLLTNHPQVSLVDLSSLNADELLVAVAALDANSAILAGTMNLGDTQLRSDETAFIEKLCELSAVPVYGLYDTYLGHGIVGGVLASGKLLGNRAAVMANQMLAGATLEQAGEPVKISNAAVDYHVLQRFQLSTIPLPAGVKIINQPFSILAEYRHIILIVLILFGILAIFIFILSRNLLVRKKIEQVLLTNYDKLDQQRLELKSSRERYQLVAEASRDAIWEWDIKQNALQLPEKWFDTYGIDGLGIVTMHDWYQWMHPEDAGRLDELIKSHLTGHSDYVESIFRMNDKDDQTRYLMINGKALFDEAGRAYRMAGSVADITDSNEQQQRIHDLAYLDSLTGLPNKTMLGQLMDEAVSYLTHANDRMALLYLDVDNFKLINDSYGHHTGDRLLMELARRLQEFTGDAQWTSRLGGDEFAILLPYTEGDNPVVKYCTQLLALFDNGFQFHGHQFNITVSIGVSIYPQDGQAFDVLLMNADTALHQAKSLRGNRFVLFEQSMSDAVLERIHMQTNLRKALEHDEFVLYFQPKYHIGKKRITGFEALIRWVSIDQGIILPARFIGVAEDTGLIVPIGEWVVGQACKFLQRLTNEGFADITVSINVSVIQLMHGDLLETIRHHISDAGIDPKRLGLEITESVLMETVNENIDLLLALRKLGVKLELDDFGSGYSSLGYLKEMPIQVLKIDKSFVDALAADSLDAPLTDTIIQLGHQLGLEVVAEGVEHYHQFEALQKGKCDYIQGYLVSRPMPEGDALHLLHQDQKENAHVVGFTGDVLRYRQKRN